MVVAYNCDENYVSTFATSMTSLFENNTWAEEITVYLVGKNISAQSRGRLEEIAASYHRNIVIMEMPTVDGLNLVPNYGRLFLGELLPKGTDKAIYADCDSIFADSLEELWNMDISDYYAGTVIDVLGPNDRKILGISKNGIYYSDALMLVNVKRWREEKIIDKFIAYIKSMKGVVPFYEMGTITAVLDGKIKILPARYNVQTPYYSFTSREIVQMRKLKTFYSEEELEAAKKSPVMIHFTVDFLITLRPWMKGCNHPCAKQYLEYRQKTPWKNEPLSVGKISAGKKAFSAFYRLAPRPVARWSVGILYTYLRPFLFSFDRWKTLCNMK